MKKIFISSLFILYVTLSNNITAQSVWTDEGNGNISYTSGNVSIGTTDAYGALNVAGKILTEEVIVKPDSTWPDYVFEDGYQLNTLTEVENFIKTYNRLPGIPSASEVKENGISAGNLQLKQMRKIEELTLYIIALNKQMNEVIEENTKLKGELLKLSR